ncbi:MAG: hypothetical protein COX43_02890 [Parcubacteria group bacterium CG23_combo_of_CG06-09_8_20_14_all_35_9]|nr:MAG: hypothetical protein COX43_02890 [Parcubacteria group bacterium CG23_combo_of_CG06-09_8_20_14_all_35_9]
MNYPYEAQNLKNLLEGSIFSQCKNLLRKIKIMSRKKERNLKKILRKLHLKKVSKAKKSKLIRQFRH